MFSSGPNYNRLKTNLKLSMTRLNLLQRKKTEQIQKMRREIVNYINDTKVNRAKIRVEYIIREDYLVEAMEIVEMFCDLLLAHFGLINDMKVLDAGIAEAVSSLIWVAPRLQTDCPELKIVAEQLTLKYGPKYTESCRMEEVTTINDGLKRKLSVQTATRVLVEKYMIEIAKSFNVPYQPDEEVLQQDGKDALLIDLSSDRNNLGGGRGGGGGMPAPMPGFIGFPQPPPLPSTYIEYNDKMRNDPTAPPAASVSPGSNFPNIFYNIPGASSTSLTDDNNKVTNKDDSNKDNLPSYNTVFPDNNLMNVNEPQKPASVGQKLNENTFNLPDLPSVPNNIGPPRAPSPRNRTDNNADFDDLNRRFMELKKKY